MSSSSDSSSSDSDSSDSSLSVEIDNLLQSSNPSSFTPNSSNTSFGSQNSLDFQSISEIATSDSDREIDIEVHSFEMMGSMSSRRSSDTEEYEVPSEEEINGEVIEINDNTQQNRNAMPFNVNDDDDDDDVILIPQNIETIDLCTQSLIPFPRLPTDEVIEITDSPVVAARSRRSLRNLRAVRENSAPYEPSRSANNVPAVPRTSTPVAKANSLSDDSQNASQSQRISVACPICLDSVVAKNPVSTTCGHIFCRTCLNAALAATRNCPMCKKKIPKNGFHDIFL